MRLISELSRAEHPRRPSEPSKLLDGTRRHCGLLVVDCAPSFNGLLKPPEPAERAILDSWSDGLARRMAELMDAMLSLRDPLGDVSTLALGALH